MKKTITVVTERNHLLRHRAELNGFDDLLIDIPKAYGGEETAPDPHDYFDVSLGACKAITAKMYADRKGWPLEGITTRVKRDDSEERKGVYKLEVTLVFHGISDPEQQARLAEISERCPIHRLMTQATVEVTTRSDIA